VVRLIQYLTQPVTYLAYNDCCPHLERAVQFDTCLFGQHKR